MRGRFIMLLPCHFKLTALQNADGVENERKEQRLHYCFSRLLHHIYYIPGPSRRRYPESWPSSIPGGHCSDVGCCDAGELFEL